MRRARYIARAAWLLVFASAGAVGCEQPRPKCSVARGSFAASYVLVEGTGPCSELRGEILGIDAYNAPRSERDQTPDYDHTTIAIQPQAITELLAMTSAEPDPMDTPYAYGAFATSEPSGELCSVPALSPARLRLPLVSASTNACTNLPNAPAVDLRYEWSNVQVYVTAGAYGSQLSADLTYTNGGCQARYRVWAVYPAVSCQGAGSDTLPAEGPDAGIGVDGGAGDAAARDAGRFPDASSDASNDASGGSDAGSDASVCKPEEPAPEPAPVIDDTLCSAQADPDHGRPAGSGINTDFLVRCDPELLLCVPSREPPSLR